MLIKLGDKIRVNHRGGADRVGTITQIGIGLTQSDPAGELGPNVEEYETELGYLGAVSFDADNGEGYWAYFDQIEEVINEEDSTVMTDALDHHLIMKKGVVR